MMINDYNNKTSVIGSNCAFWNSLLGGQAAGREKAASATGSWKDGPNWLKAGLLIALARAWEKALVWLYMNWGPLKPCDSGLDLLLQTQAEKRADVQPLDKDLIRHLEKLPCSLAPPDPWVGSWRKACFGQLMLWAETISGMCRGFFHFSTILLFCGPPLHLTRRAFCGVRRRKGSRKRRGLMMIDICAFNSSWG